MSKEDQEDKEKQEIWLRKCRAMEQRAANMMTRINNKDRKAQIKRAIERLRKEGGTHTNRFYSKIRNVLWGRKEQSVKIGI